MKLLLLVICVCFAQVCLTAPTNSGEESSSNELTDADIQDIRKTLEEVPGISVKAIDDFTGIIRKFQNNATDNDIIEAIMDLFSLALQGDSNVKIDLKKVLNRNSNSEDETNGNASTFAEGLTENELNEMKKEISKVSSPKATEHAMKILHGFRESATEQENEAATNDLIYSAIESLIRTSTFYKLTTAIEQTENNL